MPSEQKLPGRSRQATIATIELSSAIISPVLITVLHLLTTSKHAESLPRNTSTMEQISNAIAAKINLLKRLPSMLPGVSGKKVELRMDTMTLALLSPLLKLLQEMEVCGRSNSRPRLQLVLRRHTNVVSKL